MFSDATEGYHREKSDWWGCGQNLGLLLLSEQDAGRALLQQCIAWAKGKTVRHVHLSVTKGESPAIQLYKSQGFYPVEEPEFLRPGSDLQAQKMQLDLALDA